MVKITSLCLIMIKKNKRKDFNIKNPCTDNTFIIYARYIKSNWIQQSF